MTNPIGNLKGLNKSLASLDLAMSYYFENKNVLKILKRLILELQLACMASCK